MHALPLYFSSIIKPADYTTPSWSLHVSSNAPTTPNVHPSLGNPSFVIALPCGDKTSPANAWSAGAFKKHLKRHPVRSLNREIVTFWKHAGVRRSLCSSGPEHDAPGAPADRLPAGESQEHMVPHQERRSP